MRETVVAEQAPSNISFDLKKSIDTTFDLKKSRDTSSKVPQVKCSVSTFEAEDGKEIITPSVVEEVEKVCLFPNGSSLGTDDSDKLGDLEEVLEKSINPNASCINKKDPIPIKLDIGQAKTLFNLMSKIKLIEPLKGIVPLNNAPTVDLPTLDAEQKKQEEVIVEVKPSIYDIPMPIPERYKNLPRSGYRIINRVGFVVTNLAMLAIIEEYSRELITLSLKDKDWTRLATLGIMPVVWFFTIFTINCLWGAILSFIGPLHQLKQNSPFYSIIPPNITEENMPERLSSVMIQIPVYKESFQETIKPTLMSAIEACQEFAKSGGRGVVFVNDDGLVYISEEERKERIDFYNENGIFYVARPTNEVLVRRGCFKKASNMNFCVGVQLDVAEIFKQFKEGKDTSDIFIDDSLSEELQKDSILQQLARRDQFSANKALDMCDYVLILDSDSRLPFDCMLPVTVELDESPYIAFTQHMTYMMSVSGDYWEKLISHFTDRINQNAILMSTACGETAPFMGHNAFLRWSALMDVAFIDKRDGKKKIWSENRVSEDFDLAIRLYRKGMFGRYIAYGTGFTEGVALVVRDEITRLQKYAYGCAEVLCNKISTIHRKGPIGTQIVKMLGSKVQVATKVNVLCYIGTFMAMASAPILCQANYWLWYVPAYHHSNSISFTWLTMIFIFGIITPLGCLAMSYRSGMRPRLFRELFQELKACVGMGIFWSGVSFHVMVAVWQYLLGIKPQWGATAKEVKETNFFSELKSTIMTYKLMYSFSFLCTAQMVIMAYVPPVAWQITDFSSWFPLALMTVSQALMPLLLNPALMKIFY